MSNSWGGSSQTLGYRGTRATQPPNCTFSKVSPTGSNTQGVSVGDFWINTEEREIYVLLALAIDPANPKDGIVATWSEFATGGGGDVATITGNQGAAVVPDGAGNINILGDDETIISARDGANTLLLTIGEQVPAEFVTDAGTAVPAASMLRVLGGTNINTSGATNAVTINLDQTVAITGTFTAGTGITATTGNITATTGNIIATAGNVNITAGVLNLPQGAFSQGSAVINVGGERFLTVAEQTPGNNAMYFGNLAGNPAAASLTTLRNTAMGAASLASMLSGTNDTTAMGAQTLASYTTPPALTTAGNCAFGSGSLSNLLTGTSNICIGLNSGSPYTGAESNNIILSSSITTGVTGESGVMRLGTPAIQTKTFISGIAGVTTTVNDAIPVLISASTGQLGTVSSSARYKDNIRPMDIFSDLIFKLQPSLFTFKSDESKSQRWGLIAEEVAEIAPELVVYNKDNQPETVKYHDIVTLLLNEIQMLRSDVDILSKRCLGE